MIKTSVNLNVIKLSDCFVLDPDPDDLLDFGLTDVNGYFDLKGSTSESVNIEPVLRIYTRCNDDRIKSTARHFR